MKALIWAVFCLLFFPWVVQSAEFYRWTDKNGNVHLTNEPPAAAEKKLQTFQFNKSPAPVAPETQVSGEAEGTPTEGRPAELETPQENKEDLEKAEADFRHNYYNSYGSKREREYWRQKLKEVDEKKQKSENPENGETTENASSDETTDHTPK